MILGARTTATREGTVEATTRTSTPKEPTSRDSGWTPRLA